MQSEVELEELLIDSIYQVIDVSYGVLACVCEW